MEGGLELMGRGGASSGGSGNGSSSTVTKAEVVEQDHNMGLSSEVSSYKTDPAEAELELGLGLSLGGCGGGSVKVNNINNNKPFGWGERGARILTAKDLVSASFSSSSSSSTDRANGSLSSVPTAGTKRTADSVVQEMGSSNGASQVVGWPPIRAYRINSLVNQAKVPNPEDGDKIVSASGNGPNGKYDMKKNENLRSKNKADTAIGKGNRRAGNSLFVKVNMDGMPIGRKVDLSAHSCYETLAHMLEDMFNGPTTIINPICSREKDFGVEAKKPSKLLDGSSDFVLTYEDKDGDWMLVGDVPWGLFLDTVKRLRIMKTSEATGLAARFEDNNERQRRKPI